MVTSNVSEKINLQRQLREGKSLVTSKRERQEDMKSNYLMSIPSCICQGKALGLFFITCLHFGNKLFVSLKLVLYKVEVLVAMCCLSYTHIVVPFFFVAKLEERQYFAKQGESIRRTERQSRVLIVAPHPLVPLHAHLFAEGSEHKLQWERSLG